MEKRQSPDSFKISSTLCVRGFDTARFLNGMLSADIKKALEESPACGRAWILTPKARIIAPVDFMTAPHEKNEIWLFTDKADIVRSTLEKYLIADQVEISEKDISSFQFFEVPDDSSKALPPRHPLGKEKTFRFTIEDKKIFAPKDFFSASKRTWDDAFLKGQARWGVEILPDDFFLEFPLEETVSFDKGCYIGQEVVARGTFRGKVNKSFARIYSDKELITGSILDKEGNALGEIRSVGGESFKKALGLVKFSAPAEVLIGQIPHTLRYEWLVDEKTFRGDR